MTQSQTAAQARGSPGATARAVTQRPQQAGSGGRAVGLAGCPCPVSSQGSLAPPPPPCPRARRAGSFAASRDRHRAARSRRRDGTRLPAPAGCLKDGLRRQGTVRWAAEQLAPPPRGDRRPRAGRAISFPPHRFPARSRPAGRDPAPDQGTSPEVAAAASASPSRDGAEIRKTRREDEQEG